jgi:Zn-dependent protease with chaperone function
MESMFTNIRLFFLWCVLIGGILFISILPGNSSIYPFVAAYDANRWIHFLIYATVASLPTAAWKGKVKILLPMAVIGLCIALEPLLTLIPNPIVRPRNVLADVFGVSAGILLGLNLRRLRTSARSGNHPIPDPSRSTVL